MPFMIDMLGIPRRQTVRVKDFIMVVGHWLDEVIAHIDFG